MLEIYDVSDKSSVPEPPGSPGDHRAKAVHFQVNYKYRRYWSHNQVLDGDTWILELCFCPDCKEDNFIAHDERGVPVCPTCGLEFPKPKEPNEKSEKQKAYEMRQFIKKVRMSDKSRTRTFWSGINHNAAVVAAKQQQDKLQHDMAVKRIKAACSPKEEMNSPVLRLLKK